MNRCVLCSSCKQSIKIKSNAATRPDMQLERGDYFELHCKHCSALIKAHVNDIIAEISYLTILVALGIGVAISVILWKYYGAIGSVSAAIPILAWTQELKNVHLFNSYLIKRR